MTKAASYGGFFISGIDCALGLYPNEIGHGQARRDLVLRAEALDDRAVCRVAH
jgi:hypothetical protein